MAHVALVLAAWLAASLAAFVIFEASGNDAWAETAAQSALVPTLFFGGLMALAVLGYALAIAVTAACWIRAALRRRRSG